MWMCVGCQTSPVARFDDSCDTCEDARLDKLVAAAENVPVGEAPPRKVSGFTRLPDRFSLKEQVIVKDKFRSEKQVKRRGRKVRDNFRRIKMGYDTRMDLGEVDKTGNYSYEGRIYGWGTMFGVVPLTKRERENANRTNGHLVPKAATCACWRWMWAKSHTDLKAGHMNTETKCPGCAYNYTLDKYGRPNIDGYTGEDLTESPVVRW